MKRHVKDRPGAAGKRLVFEKETLRTLGGEELGHAVGGRIEPTSGNDCRG